MALQRALQFMWRISVAASFNGPKDKVNPSVWQDPPTNGGSNSLILWRLSLFTSGIFDRIPYGGEAQPMFLPNMGPLTGFWSQAVGSLRRRHEFMLTKAWPSLQNWKYVGVHLQPIYVSSISAVSLYPCLHLSQCRRAHRAGDVGNSRKDTKKLCAQGCDQRVRPFLLLGMAGQKGKNP